ncbi:hypothetical protein MSG28_010337 [Choristoneura fumiferana]|uniref:Uncharacterized protein n=1 Tax=Choristoneura fumiferana TaxID=7141 RepID=A0ACC0KK72_CHOFU|nr:hypothetical protein MSG28_010337 [Choristoneura fumiferana]
MTLHNKTAPARLAARGAVKITQRKTYGTTGEYSKPEAETEASFIKIEVVTKQIRRNVPESRCFPVFRLPAGCEQVTLDSFLGEFPTRQLHSLP